MYHFTRTLGTTWRQTHRVIQGPPNTQSERSYSVFFKIDPKNGIPIYDHIVRQVKYAIAEGTLTPGQLVPSVRELARQITVNPNTIQRAYQELQD